LQCYAYGCSHGHRGQRRTFQFGFQWDGHFPGQDAGFVRVVNRLPNPHQVKVIGELLPAVQADNIGCTFSTARFTHPGERTGKMAVGTPEQQIQQCVDHSNLPIQRNASQIIVAEMQVSPPMSECGFKPTGRLWRTSRFMGRVVKQGC
jgi:hypothetical protein